MRPRPLHPARSPQPPLSRFLPAALCPTSHPSDEKEFSFPRNISAGSLGSLLGHHHGQGAESDPHVTEPLIGGVPETRLEVEREVSVPCLGRVWPAPPAAGLQAGWAELRLHPQRELPPPAPSAGITRSKSKHELKLLEKIPENAEATVVLVGMWGWGPWQQACLSAAPGLGAGRWPAPCSCP